ncbi:putative HVA22-like protein g isoform X1 [Nymphaea colorata]|nr:putative HVA22-like protein g isoform X1 [Nymphaea colorata]
MLGDFVSGSLTLLLGYVYPAFECFKTVEGHQRQIEGLRFWCQYWIIVALLTAFEGVGSVLVSWLPMYDEFKLAFFVYLWHPKTKGASYVYDTILLPYIISHEWDIDHNVLELKTKAGHFAVLYLQTVANYGQEKFFELLQFFSSRSPKLKSDQVPEAPLNGGRHSSQSPPQTRGTPSVPQASSHEHDYVPSAPPVPREYEFDNRANEAANWRPAANGRNHGQADSFLPGTAQGGRDGLDMERMIHNAHMRLRRDRR